MKILKKHIIILFIILSMLLSPVVYILLIFYALSTQRTVEEYSKIENLDIFILNKKRENNCYILEKVNKVNQNEEFIIYLHPQMKFYTVDYNKNDPARPVPYYMGHEERIDKINVSLIKKDGKKFYLDSLLISDKDLYEGFKSDIFREKLNDCFDKCCHIKKYSTKLFSNLKQFIGEINTTHSLSIITNRKLNTLIFKVNLPKNINLKKRNKLQVEMYFSKKTYSNQYTKESARNKKRKNRVIKVQSNIVII